MLEITPLRPDDPARFEAAFAAIQEGRAGDELKAYEDAYHSSWVAKELKAVRNFKPLWSRFGTIPGIPLGGLDAKAMAERNRR